jgi:iron complex transport system substrate-binding protein
MLRYLLCVVVGVLLTALAIETFRPRGPQTLPTDDQGAFPRTVETSDGAIVIPRRPMRIVSHAIASDDILLAICPPERLAGIHALSLDPRYSLTAESAGRYREKAVTTAESVLARDPDLIFVASYSLKETVDQLQTAAQASVIRLSRFDSLADLRANILLVGRAIGEDAAAERLAAEFDRDVAAIVARIPPGAPRPRVLSYDASGFTAGSGTLFDDILRTLQADNAAAHAGIVSFGKVGREQIAAWNPEVIVCGAEPDSRRLLEEQLLADPAIGGTAAGKSKRIVVVDDATFLSASQHVTKLLERLVEALHPATKAGP